MPGALDGNEDPNKDKNKPNPDPGGDGDGGKDDDGDGSGGDAGGDGGEDKGPKSLDEAKSIIEKLRKENGKHRTTNKTLKGELEKQGAALKKVNVALGIEDENEKPEVKLANLQQQNEALQMQLGINQLARENGIPAEQDEYFSFLLGKRMEKLEEGEELLNDDLLEVVAKVKSVGGAGGAPNKSTGGGGRKPAEGGGGAVTAEQFAEMSMHQRTELFDKSPDLYKDLMSKARAKKLLK